MIEQAPLVTFLPIETRINDFAYENELFYRRLFERY